MNGERDRPTDSSAARMPFPGATMRSAVSWRSFFCTADSAGPWCVMLAVGLTVCLGKHNYRARSSRYRFYIHCRYIFNTRIYKHI